MSIKSQFVLVNQTLIELTKEAAILSKYQDKTAEDAQRMFDEMPSVITPRVNGWLNEEERWAIAFFCEMLPRKTSRWNCALHFYDIAAKFTCSLATVYRYQNYFGK
jgi:hypothetical protein